MNKIVEITKKLCAKLRFKIKLHEMDRLWYHMGGGCWGDYPPSFYYTHTKEESMQVIEEELARLRAMLAEYESTIDEKGL